MSRDESQLSCECRQTLVCEILLALFEAFRDCPTRRELRRTVDAHRTGIPQVDKEVEHLSRVIYSLALVTPHRPPPSGLHGSDICQN